MKHIVIATILLLAIPAAMAQAPSTDLTVDATAPGEYIDPAGSMDLMVDVSVGCALVVSGGGSGTLSFSADVPTYVTVSADDVAVGPADCSGGGSAQKTGTVTLSPAAGAPGLQAFNAAITAVFTPAAGSPVSNSDTIDGLAVDYMPGSSVSVPATQTFEVYNGSIDFEVDVEITANTKTMIMFLNQEVTRGSVSGLANKVFDVMGGERNATYTVTFSAPDGEWTNETLTFYSYSHCLDKPVGCDATNEINATWTFMNMTPSTGETDGDKDSPGVAMPLLFVGIALVAFLRRR